MSCFLVHENNTWFSGDLDAASCFTMTPSTVAPIPAKPPAGTVTTTFDDTLRFYLNGTRVVLDEIDPEATLLEYLRGIGLTGTKL